MMTTHPDPMEAAHVAGLEAAGKDLVRTHSGTVDRIVRAAISAYRASQPNLSEELKAIVDRNTWMLTYPRDKLSLREKDMADILRIVSDVVRACAGIAQQVEDSYPHFDDVAETARNIKTQILSLAGQPIKSEAEIRAEERDRCALELDRRERENANTAETRAAYRNAGRAIRDLRS